MVWRCLGRAALALCIATVAAVAAMAGEADNRALTAAFNASGRDLLALFATTPGNVVLSPYSIGSAMAMVLSGAKGDTAAELASVLHQRLNRDQMDAASADVLAILKSYGAPAVSPECPDRTSRTARRCAMRRESTGLAVANALLLTRDAVASEPYVRRLARDYSADVFRNAGLDDINGWVRRMTDGRIGRILDHVPRKGAVLVDAVYFKQAWRMPFNAVETTSDVFHPSPESSMKVATMHRRGYFPVISQPGFRAIRLPYLADGLSMMIVLPDTDVGTAALATRLDGGELAGLFAMLGKDVYTDLALPRFRVSFAAELESKYRQLGLLRPFDEARADFSDMSGHPKEEVKVWIGDILHHAVIEVTEAGTEAAAATATSLVEVTSAHRPDPPQPEPFVVDRPFLFYVTDSDTGAILFAGRVSAPRATN